MLQLRKAVYGLVNAPKAWYKRLAKELRRVMGNLEVFYTHLGLEFGDHVSKNHKQLRAAASVDQADIFSREVRTTTTEGLLLFSELGGQSEDRRRTNGTLKSCWRHGSAECSSPKRTPQLMTSWALQRNMLDCVLATA